MAGSPGGAEPRLRERVRSLVETRWPAVQAVTRELMNRGSVSCEEVRRLVWKLTGG